ncbi:hypothetical protein L2D25_20820 [Salmonella enterica subsp. enterica serovar Muenchen]|nr:hypothetical protein [Salmonella enterica]MCH5443890.1 hypothetical protein [Salmonella enterica subsp. enterica serovar Muenchen]
MGKEADPFQTISGSDRRKSGQGYDDEKTDKIISGVMSVIITVNHI